MGAFDEDGALRVTVRMQMQHFRNCLLWSAPLDNRVLSKDELGEISGGCQCTENGTWWWNQRIKKATKADKDAFMKW